MANEDLLQIVIVKTIKDIFKDKVLVFSNLQGVSIKGKNKWGYIKKLKDMGNMAGVSDLTILLPNGKSLWFEIKTLNGYQNEAFKNIEQLIWSEALIILNDLGIKDFNKININEKDIGDFKVNVVKVLMDKNLLLI